MRLIRFGSKGSERPGVELANGSRIDCSEFGSDFDEEFFASKGLERLSAWVDSQGGGKARRVSEAERLGPPICRPSKIVCIGLNYRDHAAETGAALPAEPVVFLKSTTALCGPNDPVVIPRGAAKLDWEVELAVVMGARASYVTKEEALGCVAGYALHNDYSERSFQLEHGGQWVKGKSADTFAPLGPCLVTPDEIQDPQALQMWLSVNQEIRQKSSTANMIFDVATLISYLSAFMTLLPGDVVSTGTPAGVGLGMRPVPVYLRKGDVVELGIEGLGRARQEVLEHS